MASFLEKIFGTYSDKEIKKIIPIVDKIEKMESEISALSDEELRQKTAYFKDLLANGKTLDDILVEAYAVVREAGKRVLNMRHFRVQLIGGVVLHQGRISEMKTGEGKTLVSTLPAYLNALEGKGVHIVTVNDYLAKRDSEWMGEIYRFLGLTVGVILHDLDNKERRAAYACDITYATNNELGFDYLRDNMVVYKDDLVQRDLHYAIIDEVDSILIDEARTPLIISGTGTKSTSLYKTADEFVRRLTKGRVLNKEEALNTLIREELKEEGDFVVDEKAKTVTLTQEGVEKAEKYFNLENLSDPDNIDIQHHINNALKAHYNMHVDKDYVVNEEGIVIVDEFTGRLMPGRRYSDGLHQAIEAKERVEVRRESKTLATITFQNFFNRYVKKSGMTGTALTEEDEFRHIYGMDVVAIPPNRPIQRKDLSDLVYRTERGKFSAVVQDIIQAHEKGQPVLVGTVSIEKSEQLSQLLKKQGIPHQVLNAKYHEKEAEIVAAAGEKDAITIATNMAGRGTDIKLGEGVPELGGLKIIGTERHESRRIDNQLRGRAGRQGDPGVSQFYISMEDELMRLFGSDRAIALIDSLGMPEDEAIENKILTSAIENAQKKVEANNFGIRKHLLEYDEVMNEQREVIYGERRQVLDGADLRESIIGMAHRFVERAVGIYTGEEENPEMWDMSGLNEHFKDVIPIEPLFLTPDELESMPKDELIERLEKRCEDLYAQKEEEVGAERMRELERVVMLKVIDQRWMDHIDDMDQMRQGIGLRAYAQRDPLIEYKFISYDMFDELSQSIESGTLRALYHVRVVPAQPEPEQAAKEMSPNKDTSLAKQLKREPVAKEMFTNKDTSLAKQPVKRKDAKVGRNDPCPCGSGRKYKQCCGRGN